MDKAEFKDWRKRMGWTQNGVAIQIGVRRETVVRYESGVLPVSMPVALLCRALERLKAPKVSP